LEYGDERDRDAAHSAIRCRDMAPGEEQEVLSLVMRGFDELVRPDFSDEGIAEFIRSPG
jgi:hypothetical protein